MTDKFIAEMHKGHELNMLSKTEDMLAAHEDVIDLSIGEPDMTTPTPIIEASYRDSLAGHTHYTAFRGDPELRAQIAKHYEEDYNIRVEDEEILVVTSANMGMFVALFTCLNPGDEVLIPDPCFPVYEGQARFCGAKVVPVATCEEEHFRFNPQRAEEYVTDKTKALIINTPCNPTGACMNIDDMKAIADFAKKYDLLVISDDIYTSMSFQEPFVPIISLPGHEGTDNRHQQCLQELHYDRLSFRLDDCASSFDRCNAENQRLYGFYRTGSISAGSFVRIGAPQRSDAGNHERVQRKSIFDGRKNQFDQESVCTSADGNVLSVYEY